MLLGKLGGRFLAEILTDGGINRAEEGIVRAGYGRQEHKNKMDF